MSILLTGVGSNGSIPLLDLYPGARAAYSYSRKLRLAYSGNCIEAFDSTTTTTQNIGFSGGAINEAAILSFGGVHDIRSKTLYDQSGNGLNLAYSVVASLPRVANTGTVEKINNKVAGNWFNANIKLAGGSAADWKFLHTISHTIYFVVKIGTSSNPGVAYPLMGTNAGTSANNGMYLDYQDNGGANDRIQHFVGNASGAAVTSPVNNTSANGVISANTLHVVSIVCDPTNVTASARSKIRIDGGAAISNNTNTAAINNVDPAFAIDIGGYGNSSGLVGSVCEAIFYPFAQTPTDDTNIINNLKAFYGIS